MYSLDKDKKTLNKLDEYDFTSLDVKERCDIEEWVANDTQILGETLLIIQKEFNGFDKTNERPDLIGLDKEGNIVIIELKRDDSGKDVNWQAIKYASYCSTLTTENIIDMYLSYLENKKDISNPDKDLASGEIAKFLNIPVEELNLNSKQRIILVATKYRKEVLATVMWLLDNDIDIKCVSIQPYMDKAKGSFYLVPTVILPPPDTDEYRIRKNEVRKELEAKKRANFAFSMVDIPIDATLISRDGKNKAIVKDNKNSIEVNGEITTLSAAAQKLSGVNYAVSGTTYWKYEGETLDQRRRRFALNI